jgi:hypothetical protein
MSYDSWVNRKRVIGNKNTKNKEKQSCHNT